jgi:hypothetical protein
MDIFRIGWTVAIILAVVTVVEYIFAIQVGNDTVRFLGLAGAGIGKAALIIYFFMHVNRLWRTEAH